VAGVIGRFVALLGGILVVMLSVRVAAAGDTPAADFVGSWGCILFQVGGAGSNGVCPAGWSRLDVAADGSYRMGQVNGHVRVSARKATFTGGLAFMGPAEMTKPGQFEFQWTDADGWRYWAVFIANRP